MDMMHIDLESSRQKMLPSGGSYTFCETLPCMQYTLELCLDVAVDPGLEWHFSLSSGVSFAAFHLVNTDSALSCPAFSLPSPVCVSRHHWALPVVTQGSEAAFKSKNLQ